MNTDLEVKVLWEVGRNDPSEPQGADREIRAERAGSETCGATYRNWIRGGADQGERAMDREALATKETFRKSGARAGTLGGLTWGDLAARLKG